LPASFGFQFRARPFFGLARSDFGNSFGDRDFELSGDAGLVVKIGNSHTRQSSSNRLLDCAKIVLFLRRNEGERVPRRLRARRASDSMYVVVGCCRHVKIHHVAEGFDVDTSRSDVRRNERLVRACLEARERRGPLRLRPVPMNAISLEPLLDKLLGQAIRTMLGTHEDERLWHLAALEQRDEEIRFQIL
jgi:hypothetical protein